MIRKILNFFGYVKTGSPKLESELNNVNENENNEFISIFQQNSICEQNRFITNTGVDRIKTIEICKWDPNTITGQSTRKVCVICPNCGKMRIVPFIGKLLLCKKCSKIKRSADSQGISLDEWSHYTEQRFHVLPEKDCIKLNKRFNNSHGHHLSRSLMIYIPKELHLHISHNLKTGNNMKEINTLAIQYLYGEI